MFIAVRRPHPHSAPAGRHGNMRCGHGKEAFSWRSSQSWIPGLPFFYKQVIPPGVPATASRIVVFQNFWPASRDHFFHCKRDCSCSVCSAGLAWAARSSLARLAVQTGSALLFLLTDLGPGQPGNRCRCPGSAGRRSSGAPTGSRPRRHPNRRRGSPGTSP